MINRSLTQGQPSTKLTARGRRELLISILRNVVLGSLTAVVYLVSIRRYQLIQEGKCLKENVCNNCDIFESCMLPQALSVKRSLIGIKND